MNLKQAFDKVVDFYDGDHWKSWAWYRSYNDKLGMSPAEMVKTGKEKKLIEFIEKRLRDYQRL